MKIEKTGVRMGHRRGCTGEGEWIKSPKGKRNFSHLLEKEFLAGLNDYFGDLCNDENYVKPAPLRVSPEIHSPPELQDFVVMTALSKLKKPLLALIGFRFGFRVTIIAQVSLMWRLLCGTYKSLSLSTWPTAWKEGNINPLPKVDTPLQYSDFLGN